MLEAPSGIVCACPEPQNLAYISGRCWLVPHTLRPTSFGASLQLAEVNDGGKGHFSPTASPSLGMGLR